MQVVTPFDHERREGRRENGNVLISQVSDSVKLMNQLRTSFLFTFTSWAVITDLKTPITANSTWLCRLGFVSRR